MKDLFDGNPFSFTAFDSLPEAVAHIEVLPEGDYTPVRIFDTLRVVEETTVTRKVEVVR